MKIRRTLLILSIITASSFLLEAQNTWTSNPSITTSSTCSYSMNNGSIVTKSDGSLCQCSNSVGSSYAWNCIAPPSGSVPSGVYVFIKAGACPSGYTEDDTLATYNIQITTTAAGNVGTSGGSNSFTPAGTVTAPTVNSLTAAAQIFTGASDTTNAVSGGTPSGTNSSGSFTEGTISWPAGVPTNGATATSGNCASTAIAAGTGSLNACKNTAPNLTVPAETISWPAGVPNLASGVFTQPTFAGNILATHTHTVTPTGTNGTSSVTGTLNAPSFSGTPATLNTPFFKMIACAKI